MVRPPSLTSLPRYPVTGGVGLAALAVTGLWWSGQDIGKLFMDGQVWAQWELWRALTCTLPHVNLVHLAFNLYWLWVLGTILERAYGPAHYAGMLLLLALGSSLGEFSLLNGGVGLSGVGYGLWAMLWALDRHDPRFAGAMDSQTSKVFVLWFFVCIGLTLTDVMPVANIAHGIGAVMGALLGLAVSSRPAVRWKCVAGLSGLLVLGLAGSTVFWPWINLSADAEAGVEHEGVVALEKGDVQHAVKWLETSAHMRRAPARAWYNLGIAYQTLQRTEEALAAYEHAAAMPDATDDMHKAAQEMRAYLDRRHTK